MTKIFYSSALAGAGKTYSIVNIATQLVNKGEYVLVIQPTHELMDETIKKFSSVHVHSITGKTVSKGVSVASALTRYLRDPHPDPHVLIITHAAFLQLPYFHYPKRWNLFLDEIPANCWEAPHFKAKQSHRKLTDHLQMVPMGAEYARLLVTDTKALKAFAQVGPYDDAYRELAALAGKLVSGKWEMIVDQKAYGDLIAGRSSTFAAFLVLRPSILDEFASATVCGALCEQTFLFKFWSSEAKWVESDKIKSSLRYTEHPNGQHLTIYHAVDRPWSQNLKAYRNGALYKEIISSSKSVIGDQRFLWLGNKKESAKMFGSSKVVALPPSPHGLNSYTDVHGVVCTAAFNLNNFQIELLGLKGISREDTLVAIQRHGVYQGVMRCSLRNPDCTDPRTVVVMDKPTADFLANLFPGSKAAALPGVQQPETKKPGRTNCFAAAKDRVANYRMKLKALGTEAKLSEWIEDIGSAPDKGLDAVESCNDIYYNNTDHAIHMNVWGRTNHTTPCETQLFKSFGELSTYLRSKQQISVRPLAKSDSPGITLARFRVLGDGKKGRKQEDVLSTNVLSIDIDESELDYPFLANTIFPAYQMAIFSSYSRKSGSGRYRVLIPLARHVNAVQYRFLVELFVSAVEKHGFRVADKAHDGLKPHGIDPSKVSASDLFYVPCPTESPKDTFFTDYIPGRASIDPREWIEAYLQSDFTDYEPLVRAYDEAPGPHDRDEAAVARAIANFDLHGTGPGQGDRGLWVLALGLRSAGVDHDEAVLILRQQAAKANRPGDRIRTIPRILKRLLFPEAALAA